MLIKRENVDISIASLVPYTKNARTHSEAQVEQIAASMREFGFTNPLLVDEDNGVIAGHGRLAAAQRIGMDSVPAVRLTGLTEAQKKALVIADNKLAENAAWDEAMLSAELRNLQDMGYDLNLTGFAGDELKNFLGDIAGAGFPDLPDGDKEPFQQITFTLHDSQAETVKAAMEAAKAQGGAVSDVSENSNGNLIAHICGHFLNKGL